MPEQIHVSPAGVKYRLVASRTTTPTNDTSAKEIIVNSASLEVIVSDSRLRSVGSQWGHVAIEIDGTVYSRAHEEYVKIDKAHLFLWGHRAFDQRINTNQRKFMARQPGLGPQSNEPLSEAG